MNSTTETAAVSAVTPVTTALARWVTELRYEDLPDSVVHQVKRLILDYYSAVIAGSTAPTSRAVQSYFAQTESGSAAGVVGTQDRFAAHTAAFINGTAAHGLELDDGYTPGSYHPGAACLPAAMAVAQAQQSSTEDLVTAVVVAYELSCRLARAGHPHTWQNGFHNTGINGVFGAAAAVGKLLKLSQKHMAWTLGMAGSFSSGLFEFLGEGSEVKRLHPGKCARDGVVVANLAARGVDGPVTGIEGANGYFKAYSGGKAAVDGVLQDLGSTYELLKTYVKPYPCCRHLHAPMDAILAIKKRHSFGCEDVKRVLIQTNRVAAKHAHAHYDAFLDAQMSIPYAIAVALLHDEIGLTAFNSTSRSSAAVARLVPCVVVEVSDDMQAAYPIKRPARVQVELIDGRVLSYTQDQPYGEPDNPLDDAALTAKFRAICDPVIGVDKAQAIASACWALDLPTIFELTAMDPSQMVNAAD